MCGQTLLFIVIANCAICNNFSSDNKHSAWDCSTISCRQILAATGLRGSTMPHLFRCCFQVRYGIVVVPKDSQCHFGHYLFLFLLCHRPHRVEECTDGHCLSVDSVRLSGCLSIPCLTLSKGEKHRKLKIGREKAHDITNLDAERSR